MPEPVAFIYDQKAVYVWLNSFLIRIDKGRCLIIPLACIQNPNLAFSVGKSCLAQH